MGGKVDEQTLSEEEADDIVDWWHGGWYPPDMQLRDVFVDYYKWTDVEFEVWVTTGRVPNDRV